MKRHLTAAVSVTGRHRIAQRLATGAQIVYRRRADALTAWVAAGRRDDLTGWRAALGPAVRLLILAAAAAGAYRAVRAAHWLMWVLAAGCAVAAWRATRAPAEDTVEEPEQAPAGPDMTAVLHLLAEVLDGRDRVHLSTVLTHLQKQGHGQGWKVADLRARLEALGVPVALKVKVAGVPTRGILRADLDRHFPDWETHRSSEEVDAA
ncbi:hypothetical protein ACF09L_19165 [Streptomyces sp. NPDC014779]|uniref:hypothetical protein n=1 Tax=Streptomyces sp. NPDC014779 TaxID=3364911 RepID=UPI0036FF5939